MSLAPSGVVTVNARSHGQATAGSCFATLVSSSKKQIHNASLGRRLPDTVDLSEGVTIPSNSKCRPIVGLIASSVGKNEGRHGLRPSIALHIGGAKTCPRQLVGTTVLPGRPVMLNVAKNKRKRETSEKTRGEISASATTESDEDSIIFGSCISGGAADSSIDVVLGGQYNAYVRGHKAYHDKYFQNE